MTVRELFSKIQDYVEWYANETILWFGEGVIKLYELRWLDFTIGQAIFTILIFGSAIGGLVAQASEIYEEYMDELKGLDWNALLDNKESVPIYVKVWVYTKLFAVFIWTLCWHIFGLIILAWFVYLAYDIWLDK
jgi:hypothetical protein